MHSHSSAYGTPTTAGRVLHGARFYDVVAFLLTFGREKRIRHETVELAGVRPGGSVLDVGCGTGSLTLAAKAAAGPGGRVCGIDPSPEMIQASEKKARKARREIDFRVGVVEDLPFDDGSFDVVLSSLMLHHLPDEVKRTGFDEIVRVLRPGGRFVAVDLAGGSPSLAAHLPFCGHMKKGSSTLERDAEMLRAAGFADIATGNMSFRLLAFLVARRA